MAVPRGGLLPEAAFALVCATLLPENWPCMAHKWLASTTSFSTDAESDNYICESCSAHATMHALAAAPLDPLACVASISTVPVESRHHLHVVSSVGGTLLEFTCCKCHGGLSVTLAPPILPQSSLKRLCDGHPDSHQIAAVQALLNYSRDRLNGKSRSINALNEKFSRFVGNSEDGRLLLFLLGFIHVPEQNQYVAINGEEPQELSRKCKFAILELSRKHSEIYQRIGAQPKADAITFVDASESITLKFGTATVPNVRQLSLTSKALFQFYLTLGCLPDSSEGVIKERYLLQAKEDRKSLPWFLDALVQISVGRNSAELQEFAAMEQTRDDICTLEDIAAAHARFSISSDSVVTDENLISLFHSACKERPYEIADYRKALRIIADARDSLNLQLFLESGDIPRSFEEASADVIPESRPRGLENIGNSCYLNSLLQFYFTVNPLRESILGWMHQDVDPSDKPLSTAARFTELLSTLFTDLLHSADFKVAPARELVDLALKATSEELSTFGLQQDVNECMENILELLEIVFKLSSLPTLSDTQNVIKGLFYGSTTQILSYTESGVEQRSEKLEDYSSLILEVSHELTQSLEAFFQPLTVEYNGKSAVKRVVVSKLPPFLSITLKRVQFDATAGTAFKNNDFMRFDKTLSLSKHCLPELEANATFKLHAVFMHQGLPQFGHYWVYIQDHESGEWWNFNDTDVSRIDEAEVFASTAGLEVTNAYCLVYVREWAVAGLVKTISRPQRG